MYEDKPVHPLPHGITLNAINSTLATASKASLLFVIGASVGQLKWERFRQQPKLYDLQAFDDVSRGPLGSISILFERSRGFPVTLRASITVTSLLLDPFVQQILRYPIRSTPLADGIAHTQKGYAFLTQPSSTDLMSALNFGLWSDSSQFERTPTCTSADCTWPNFHSLGWCSKCEDVTASVKMIGDCNYKGDYWINGNCCMNIAYGPDFLVSRGAPGRPYSYYSNDTGPYLNLTNDIV